MAPSHLQTGFSFPCGGKETKEKTNRTNSKQGWKSRNKIERKEESVLGQTNSKMIGLVCGQNEQRK